MNGELPELIEIHERTSRNVMRCAPLIDGFFRSEEKHGRSGKNEIVPPVRRRDREMREVGFQNRCTVFYFENQRLNGVTV